MTHDENMKFWGIDTGSKAYRFGQKVADTLLKRVRCPTCGQIHQMPPDLTSDQVRPLFPPGAWVQAGNKPEEEPYIPINIHRWRLWTEQIPPRNLIYLEIWRHEWAAPELVRQVDVALDMNIVGLYWREP